MTVEPQFAPIALFTYKRLDTLKKCIQSLSECNLASETEIFFFSDGSNAEENIEKVKRVRDYLREIQGFKNITILESPKNRGLANSVITGVTEIINQYGKVIVLEDDLVVSKNFLNFMNDALNFYSTNSKIFAISGYTPIINGIKKDEVYFTLRSSSWGWATWKDRWDSVDWNVSDYNNFINDKGAIRDFKKMGSDMPLMLKRQMNGEINSWAIRWCYSQYKHNLFTVFPAISKVINIGFDSDLATHTKEKNTNRFFTVLDEAGSNLSIFSNNIKLNKSIVRQFVKPYSFKSRLIHKILNYNILENITLFIKISSRKY